MSGGAGVPGTILPGFLDAHVHLALIDAAGLADGGIARVIDLGGPLPGSSADDTFDDQVPTRVSPRSAQLDHRVEVAFAGRFLTAPGGYPVAQRWTPPGSVREVTSTADAAAAVDEQLTAGASVIKVTLNSDVGPVLDADMLAAIIARAHEHVTPVVAHAQGAGQAERALSAGVDALAHTPFSERLPGELIRAMARRMTWISTLDIHGWGEVHDWRERHDRSGNDFNRATDNLSRFHAAGGRILYGTDLGNGPLPVGLNRREITALLNAGLSPDDVLAALTADGFGIGGAPGHAFALSSTTPAAGLPSGARLTLPRLTLIRGERPDGPQAFTDWLCTARALTRTELEELTG